MEKETELLYNIKVQLVISNTSISIDRKCNSVTILNQGATIITINNTILLYPGIVGTNSGESYTFGGNRNELFKGSIDIAFAAGAGSNCIVLQKIYVPELK